MYYDVVFYPRPLYRYYCRTMEDVDALEKKMYQEGYMLDEVYEEDGPEWPEGMDMETYVKEQLNPWKRAREKGMTLDEYREWYKRAMEKFKQAEAERRRKRKEKEEADFGRNDYD